MDFYQQVCLISFNESGAFFLFSKLRDSCSDFPDWSVQHEKGKSQAGFFDVTLALIGLSDKEQLAAHSRVLFNSSSLYLNLSAFFIVFNAFTSFMFTIGKELPASLTQSIDRFLEAYSLTKLPCRYSSTPPIIITGSRHSNNEEKVITFFMRAWKREHSHSLPHSGVHFAPA